MEKADYRNVNPASAGTGEEKEEETDKTII